MSIYAPLGLGLAGGILSAIMGVGGGFFLVPAMIYLIGMPTRMVVGTSLFQVIFVTANVTFLQAATLHTVDIVLSAVLIVGGVIGAQFGSRLGGRMRGEDTRIVLALLVLIVAVSLLYGLLARPDNPYSLTSALS